MIGKPVALKKARRPVEKPLGTKRQANRDKTLGSSEVDGWEIFE